MREIKFRAWDKETKKMGMVEYIDFSYRANNINFIMCRIEGVRELMGDSFKIMQYTGSKDKNGKEIYEGDIVEAEMSGPYTNGGKIIVQGEIAYYEPFACFEVKTEKYGQPTMSIFDTFEVIGNKYEDGDIIECS